MFLILIEIFKCLKDKTELVALTFLSTIRHFGANLQSNKLAVEKVAIIVNWYYQGNLNARKFFHSHNNKSTKKFFFSVIRVNGFQTMLKTSGLLHEASLTLFLIDLIAI